MDMSRYHEIRLVDTQNLEVGHPSLVDIAGLEVRPRPRFSWRSKHNVVRGMQIVRVLEPQERQQLLTGRAYLEYDRCCSHCGGALDRTKCLGCGLQYRDTGLSQSTGVSLPPIIRRWFEQRGHKFEL
jgi:hypothetical protein